MSETIAPDVAETWGILSQFGHTTHAGRITEIEMFGEKMGRIDVPQADGSFETRIFGGKSVFDLRITTEQAARDHATRMRPAAVQPWEPPALSVATDSRHACPHCDVTIQPWEPTDDCEEG